MAQTYTTGQIIDILKPNEVAESANFILFYDDYILMKKSKNTGQASRFIGVYGWVQKAQWSIVESEVD